MYPEYFKINGRWTLAEDSRMDSCVVIRPSGRLDVVESRNIKKGDAVIVGRTDHGEEGIYLHSTGFAAKGEKNKDHFAFRQGLSILRSLPMVVPETLGDCHGPTALAMTCSFLEKMPLPFPGGAKCYVIPQERTGRLQWRSPAQGAHAFGSRHCRVTFCACSAARSCPG